MICYRFNSMGDFVRTRSKVWWGNYQHGNYDEEEEDDWEARRETGAACSASIASTDSDRGSSGSPESHRSQDSGFSDSDGSPPNVGGVTITRIPRVTLTRAGKIHRQKEEDDGLSPSTPVASKTVIMANESLVNNDNETLESLKILQENDTNNNKTPVKGRVMSQINKFEIMVTSIEDKPQSLALKVLNEEDSDIAKQQNTNIPHVDSKDVDGLQEETNNKTDEIPIVDRVHDSPDDSSKSSSKIDSLSFSNYSNEYEQSTDGSISRFGERFKTQVEVADVSSPKEANHGEERSVCRGGRSLPGSPMFRRDRMRKSVFGYLDADDEPRYQSAKKINNQENNDSLDDKLRSLHVYLTDAPFVRSDSPQLNRSLENTRISKSRMSPISHTRHPKAQNLNRSFGGSESLPYEINTEPLQTRLNPPQTEESATVAERPLDVSSSSSTNEFSKYLGKYSSPNSSTWSIPGPPAHASTPKSPKTNCAKTPRSSRKSQRLNFDQKDEEGTATVCRPTPTLGEGDPPLNQWLKELKFMCDPECMTTLQSKSLSADLSQQITVMAAVTTEAVRILQQQTKLISAEFSKLYSGLRPARARGPLVQSLVGHINEFMQTCRTSKSDKQTLTAACDKLKSLAFSASPDRHSLTVETTVLGNTFTNSVDTLLYKQIKVLMTVLDEPNPPAVTLAGLSSLTSLGLEGKHLSQLIARCGGGIRSLLSLCLDSKSVAVRTAALRTLATVCCTTHTIRQLEKAGGIDILTDILQDENRSETELTESVSVIVQITAPWIEDNHSVFGLTQQLTPLVSSLTRMVSNTTDSTTLLLCAAALSHLTQLEPQSIWTMMANSTVGTLLLAIRRQGPYASVFLREQAAGLLANMAAVAEARTHLTEHRAVVALLCFLQVRHSPLQHAAEISAAERLQHKSAIALSRMCTDQEVAAQVVELQGVQRLVKLCREERERNNSDGVLVACLAALRKIVANCGSKSVEELNALELVEPRLLDSFLIYSSRQESYV
ncbi:uncharacterized protein LOC111052039 [Nilaparvata lugens]|uniref:uncharacterized protein LOC111052039 n=1 Tax=Nilaparvata lugens TaxID=108931 RepID=UPI00193C8B75|nr:uncharacterized protein LOC111052039 [Nilaparvata lugens]